MVGEVSGSGDYQPTYKMEGKTFETWKNFWQDMFKDHEMQDKEVYQMTDNFVKQISQQINHILKRSLDVQKAINKSYETGEAPEPV